MGSSRRDPRYLQADAAIRSAFVGLFERKDIGDITASEVIRAAGVNRSTFYAHYADKYELLEAVERDFLGHMQGIFRESPTLGLFLGQESDVSAWRSYFDRLMGFLFDNRQLLAGLVRREGSSFMVDFSNAFAGVLRASGEVSKLGIPVDYQAALLAWSTAGLVEEWARGGFVDGRGDVVRILVNVATSIQEAVLG